MRPRTRRRRPGGSAPAGFAVGVHHRRRQPERARRQRVVEHRGQRVALGRRSAARSQASSPTPRCAAAGGGGSRRCSPRSGGRRRRRGTRLRLPGPRHRRWNASAGMSSMNANRSTRCRGRRRATAPARGRSSPSPAWCSRARASGRSRVPPDRGVEVGVRLDQPRGHDASAASTTSRRPAEIGADLDDRPARTRTSARHGGRAGAVDHVTSTDQQVAVHARPFCAARSPPRGQPRYRPGFRTRPNANGIEDAGRGVAHVGDAVDDAERGGGLERRVVLAVLVGPEEVQLVVRPALDDDPGQQPSSTSGCGQSGATDGCSRVTCSSVTTRAGPPRTPGPRTAGRRRYRPRPVPRSRRAASSVRGDPRGRLPDLVDLQAEPGRHQLDRRAPVPGQPARRQVGRPAGSRRPSRNRTS